MLPEVRSYKREGSSFHLTQDEARAAQSAIGDFYRWVGCETGSQEGRLVYHAKNGKEFDILLQEAACLSKEA